MALSGQRFRRRKKEDVFVDGYFIDAVTDVTPGADRTDEQFHVYGNDSPELDVVNNFGTMAMTMLDKYTSNALLDVVNGYNPEATIKRQYNVNTIVGATVFANVKDKLNTKYVKAYIIEDWIPGLPVPTGDANAKASWQITGNGKLPRTFENCWIKTKKVASGAAISLSPDTPILVPQESVYAVHIRAIKDQGGTTIEQQSVSVSADMVRSDGAVDWGAIGGAVTDFTGPTHALIFYLQSGLGVYPTMSFGKLRA